MKKREEYSFIPWMEMENWEYIIIYRDHHITCTAMYYGKKEMEKKLKNYTYIGGRLYTSPKEKKKRLFTVKIYMMLISFSYIL